VAIAFVGQLLHFVVFVVSGSKTQNCKKYSIFAFLFNEPNQFAVGGNAHIELPFDQVYGEKNIVLPLNGAQGIFLPEEMKLIESIILHVPKNKKIYLIANVGERHRYNSMPIIRNAENVDIVTARRYRPIISYEPRATNKLHLADLAITLNVISQRYDDPLSNMLVLIPPYAQLDPSGTTDVPFLKNILDHVTWMFVNNFLKTIPAKVISLDNLLFLQALIKKQA
jgi:hypothetical protein